MPASSFNQAWLLHALLWIPLVGALHVLVTPHVKAKVVALCWSSLVFILSIFLWLGYVPEEGSGYQMASSFDWIEQFGVRFSLGVDGISLFMLMLTTFITPIAILGAFEYIKKKEKAFYSLMLLLEFAVLGVFSSTDMFLFYVFFELTLIPMYFIVGIWGGDRRIYAAVKFFLYTSLGSLLMLVAILYMYTKGGSESFAISHFLEIPLSMSEQLWLFGAFGLAFAIKIPLFPLHTWLPDAHVEAPTPGSVVLASVLLKMGTYGFIRFLLPFFPLAASSSIVVTVLMGLGVIGILFCSWVAAVQTDAKKLVAYTSVAHMGFVVLGIFALNENGLQGAMIIMISHGLSTGALFLLLGMLYERSKTRNIADFGGLATMAPWLTTAFLISAFASIGVPGTSGFTGEFLALIGIFEAQPTMAIFAASGVVFAAYYMLPMIQSIFFNKTNEKSPVLNDLSLREILVLFPLIVGIMWLGVYPKPFMDRMAPSLNSVIERVEEARRIEQFTGDFVGPEHKVIVTWPGTDDAVAISATERKGC
jgi:NADH-quinone oxidoreductase subunit M